MMLVIQHFLHLNILHQGQTSFSGKMITVTLSYTVGVNNVQVYVNGVLLDSSDYTTLMELLLYYQGCSYDISRTRLK